MGGVAPWQWYVVLVCIAAAVFVCYLAYFQFYSGALGSGSLSSGTLMGVVATALLAVVSAFAERLRVRIGARIRRLGRLPGGFSWRPLCLGPCRGVGGCLRSRRGYREGPGSDAALPSTAVSFAIVGGACGLVYCGPSILRGMDRRASPWSLPASLRERRIRCSTTSCSFRSCGFDAESGPRQVVR